MRVFSPGDGHQGQDLNAYFACQGDSGVSLAQGDYQKLRANQQLLQKRHVWPEEHVRRDRKRKQRGLNAFDEVYYAKRTRHYSGIYCPSKGWANGLNKNASAYNINYSKYLIWADCLQHFCYQNSIFVAEIFISYGLGKDVNKVYKHGS